MVIRKLLPQGSSAAADCSGDGRLWGPYSGSFIV